MTYPIFAPVIPVSPTLKKRIVDNYQELKFAAGLTSLPWQMLAAIWARESSCRKVVTILGGPMQFDPVPSNKKFHELLKMWSNADDHLIQQILKAGPSDFQAAFILAGCFVWDKIKLRSTQWTLEQVAEAFYRYNGASYGGAFKSPYVMNGYNKNFKPMYVKGTINGEPVNTEDKNPGALVVYQQLKLWYP